MCVYLFFNLPVKVKQSERAGLGEAVNGMKGSVLLTGGGKKKTYYEGALKWTR